MDTSINTINTSVNTIESKVQSLGDLINGSGDTNGIIATINSSIKTLDTSVNTLESKVKTLEDFNFSSKANASQAKGNGFIDASVTIAEDSKGKLVNTGSSIEINLTTGNATYTGKTGNVAAKLEAPTTTGLMTTASIEPIKNYIDAVALENQEGLTVLVDGNVSTNIAQVDSTDDHKLTLKTSTLGAVNISKNSTSGNWEVSEGTYATTGLALAADVASEMIKNELVVATALNEFNTRFKWIEL